MKSGIEKDLWDTTLEKQISTNNIETTIYD